MVSNLVFLLPYAPEKGKMGSEFRFKSHQETFFSDDSSANEVGNLGLFPVGPVDLNAYVFHHTSAHEITARDRMPDSM